MLLDLSISTVEISSFMSNLSPIVNIASKVSLTAAVSLFIMAILTLILITYNESASIRHENIIKSRLSMQSVITILEEHKKDLGYYPSDISQLTGVYLSKTPVDIWGNEYLYDYSGVNESYRIYTLGSDGVVGGDQDRRDYDNNTNWRLVY
jgi:general secretion pathway protein G